MSESTPVEFSPPRDVSTVPPADLNVSPDPLPLDLHRSPKSHKSATPDTSLNKSSDKSPAIESATTPVKNRRKRKPNVTKKVTPMEIDDTANNASFDIESGIPSSKIGTSHGGSNESDECETIDKIDQMVKNITANNVQVIPIPAVTEPKPNVELIEDQLEQMFADSTSVPVESTIVAPEAALEGEPPKKKAAIKPRKPRKKKVDGAPVRKRQAVVKNGKPGKKGKKSLDSVEPPVKVKSKENGTRKVKPDVAPFVQIQKDGSFSIVNQVANGDDDAEKTVNKVKKVQSNDKHRAIRGLHVSTLSNKYDADKRDLTWVCVFCKLGPHKFKLGDLFGPYIISKTSEDFSHCLQDPGTDIFRQTNKNKFVKPPVTPEKPPKKKRKSNPQAPAVSTDEIFNGMSKVDENNYEIWFHEDCIVWASGVYIIGTKIVGMEAAIWSSTRYRCAYCDKNGAMVSCLNRACRKPAHFGCAKTGGWKLDEEFKTLCEAHQPIKN